jgi:hypothetical protein
MKIIIQTPEFKPSISLKEFMLTIPGTDEYVKASSSIFEDAILKAVENAQRRLRIRKTQLMVSGKRILKEKSK